MVFERQQNITITGHEDKSVIFFVPGISNTEGVRTGTLEIQLTQSNGKIKLVSYDLLAHLGDDAAGLVHRDNLLDLLDYIESRILVEVLP